MAPNIVSWGDNEICISPVLSSAASIISFDSTFSDTSPSRSQMSPTTSEDPGLPSAGFSEGKIPRGGHTTPDDSFIRHDAYFFKDETSHFWWMVRCTAYIDTSLLAIPSTSPNDLPSSTYMITKLPTIISIGDVERKDFEALLSVWYPAKFEAHELTYGQWKSSIKPPTSHDLFVLARTYSVDHWVLPALTALCGRSLPLSLDEARQMSMGDVILVATVREEIRGGRLRVDVADIPRHVEVAQAGKLNRRSKGNDVYLDTPRGGQKSDSTKSSAVNPGVEAEDRMAMGVTVVSPGPQQKATKESNTDESDVGRPSYVEARPAESGESQLPPLMGKTLPAETQGPEEVAHTKELLTVGTDVPPVADAATAGPTTAGNSPEGGGEGIEKAAHDEWDDWDIPVKKGGTIAGTATIPSGDDWAILGASIKNKKKRK
ncbi:hypothetical protein EDB84DRAFT_1564465 [Lactarius hengduanensis]|nr:hypothetical protein EDB84DRAFT_1564465 [Lactarius hengduanensis]